MKFVDFFCDHKHFPWECFFILYFVLSINHFISALCFNVKNHVLDETINGATLTNTWSVKLNVQYGESVETLHQRAHKIAESLDMKCLGQVGELAGHYIFTSNASKGSSFKLINHADIEWQFQQHLLKRDKRSPIKARQIYHDVSFKSIFSDPLFSHQWHLKNYQSKFDCNVSDVWKNGITGQGVVVAVVDDGVQWRHPDLRDNYCPEGSFDLNSDDDDPTPEPDKKDQNKHGTRCAGEIAAVTNNVCGVGLAYKAKFSGIRILDGPMTDSIEATAFNKHMSVNDIYSCSWGPEDDGKTVDGPRSLAQAALQHGVIAGRSGFGSIFIVASGNGGSVGDNCNYDGYANSIYTITIAAIDEFGHIPPYSENCVSMLACTVSSGTNRARSISTTDWTLGKNNGLCTDDHTGTSAATPLVAGMVALMLETRPCLSWRDVQYIIAMTATFPNYDENELWTTNAANFSHSTSHGFGLLDSWKLVNAAKTWKPIPWLTSIKPRCLLPTNNNIPKGKAGPLVVATKVTEKECDQHLLETLEQVLITVSISHPSRGNLRFVFVCPSGTHSTIPPRKKDKSSDGLSDWTFSTVRCWGEKPFGKYELKIFDVNKNKQLRQGALTAWQITLYGSQMTSADIIHRRKIINEAMNGKYISPDSNYSLPCPLRQPLSFDITKALSARTLKLVVMLSCFFAFFAAYYSVEMACCNEEDKNSENSSEATAGEETSDETVNSSENMDTNRATHEQTSVGNGNCLTCSEGETALSMLLLSRKIENEERETTNIQATFPETCAPT